MSVSWPRTLALTAGGIVLLGLIPFASADTSFSGIGHAKDGDSLMVGNTEVRLFGIDAPEWDQACKRDGREWACGQVAAKELMDLVTGKEVSCTKVDIDQHGRTVARCSVGPVDVNRTMVALGYAVAYRHYSTDYVSAEQSAKVNRRGLWAGTFEMPSDYRHEEFSQPKPAKAYRERPVRVATSRASSQPTGGCMIKGNRGPHGWIYHVPGMPYYEQTHAEEMFCTEAQAQAEGYRRAKVR